MPAPSIPLPGATYKFTVKSAAEAARTIRERLGPEARVVSVRTVPSSGLSRLWSAPRIEVIAQLPAAPPPEPEMDLGRAGRPAPPPPFGLPGAAGGRALPSTPVASLSSLLRRSGLSEVALARLQGAPFWPELAAAPLHRALVEIGRKLQTESAARRRPGPLGRVAFLGSAGSGRTTALCKWLGAEVFRRGRAGAVVSVEFDRPNPPGVLPLFGEALGVPVQRHPAVLPPPGAGFVAYDLPALSLARPESNAALGEFLDRERVSDRVLVINAAYDHAVLRSTYAAGRALGATHLVFTHLDEVPQWGGLWDYLIDRALEPLFLAAGPSLTGECEDDVFGAMIRRTLAAGAGEAEETVETPAAALSP